MPKRIKHINADLLSDNEMEMFSEKFNRAEKKMDEKLAEEIYHRNDDFVRDNSGIWTPKKYS